MKKFLCVIILTVLAFSACVQSELSPDARGVERQASPPPPVATPPVTIEPATPEAPVLSDLIITGSPIAAGRDRSYVILSDGSLWGWGLGPVGDGAGARIDRHEPVQIMENARAVFTDFVMMAITENGILYAWGIQDRNGMLGDGTRNNSSSPIEIARNVRTVSTSETHSAMVKQDGRMYTWGGNMFGQRGDGVDNQSFNLAHYNVLNNVVDVAVGNNFTAAVKDDGTLWAWGDNRNYQLAGATAERLSNVPVMIFDDVVSIEAGNANLFAIRSDGSLYAWGLNTTGRLGLGDGTPATVSTPTMVMDNVIAVSAGYNFTMAIRNDNSLWAWGLGIGLDGVELHTHNPVHIMDNVAAISNQLTHALAVTKDGELWTWGQNQNGRIDGTGRYAYFDRNRTIDTPMNVMSGVLLP